MQRQVQALVRGERVEDPELMTRVFLLLQAFPGYTARSLLAEPAETFEGLWAMSQAEIAVGNAKANAQELTHG